MTSSPLLSDRMRLFSRYVRKNILNVTIECAETETYRVGSSVALFSLVCRYLISVVILCLTVDTICYLTPISYTRRIISCHAMHNYSMCTLYIHIGFSVSHMCISKKWACMCKKSADTPAGAAVQLGPAGRAGSVSTSSVGSYGGDPESPLIQSFCSGSSKAL